MYRSLPEAPIIVTVAKDKVCGIVAATGEVAWTFALTGITSNDVARLLVTDEYVYLLGGGLTCLRYPTGEVVWQNPNGPRGGTFILQDGRLLVAWSSRHYAHSAADGSLIWQTDGPGTKSAIGAPWNVTQGDLE